MQAVLAILDCSIHNDALYGLSHKMVCAVLDASDLGFGHHALN